MGRALHGRDADLAAVDETLGALRTGRGRALFLTGEAGIGKSTLLAEARERAGDALVLSGAAWESGGAPPYWPWLQVLRDAADQLGDRVRSLPGADRIASLVDAWGTAASEPSPVDGAAARFALLDAVVRALLAIAAERPFLLLLDDLHAADLPTLDLLVMLVRELPRGPVALIAAWREGELAVRQDAAQRLTRAMRGGSVRPLRRLTSDEVARWVGADARAVFAATEGNPLFVEETLRTRSGGNSSGTSTAIADHLSLVDERTRAQLAIAAVFGRQFDASQIVALSATDEDAVAVALREAAAVGIVEPRDKGWAFRHVLLRDHLYNALPPSQRTELHRRAGEMLEASAPARAAHHLLAGVANGDVGRAVTAARAGATHATRIYAFEEAVDLLAAALAALETTPLARSKLAIDVRLDLAEARHQIGAGDLARADCIKAAELARASDDAERLARAAMVYALELLSGGRDPVMIALLDEAQSKLGTGDTGIRARVIARWAAAVVPGPDHEVVAAQKIARDAVAMARRLGDADCLLFVLRYATHAHSYHVPHNETHLMTCEVIAISDQLGRPLEAIDHRAWLVGSNLARGDLAGAETALASFEALVAPLPQPHYRWRAPILRAAWAIRGGHVVEAERHIAIARDLGREHELERAVWASRFATLSVLDMTRDPERANKILDDIRQAVTSRIGAGAGAIISFVLAMAGRLDEARAELDRARFFPALVVLHFGVTAICAVGHPALAQQILPMVERQTAAHPLAYGPQGSIFLRPSATLRGELYALLGNVDAAIVAFEEGLALSRVIESPPSIAVAAAQLAPLLAQRARSNDRERAAVLEAEAIRLARVFDIQGLVPAARRDAAPSPSPARAAAAGPALSITCNGDRARVQWNARTIETPSAKGFEFLAALIATPGREIHVSDLIGDDDRGDAGEVFDAKAKASYRARIEALQAELDTAAGRNDLGRAEKLRSELEAITDELLAGTGLGGRTRKAGSRVERARVNVQRRIKDAIRRLGAEDEALGRYLDATVRTGTFCSFVPVST